MPNEKSQTIFQFIESRQVQALVTATGILVLLANVWLASKLAPLAASIDSLEARADHSDSTLINFVPRSELIAIIEPIREDVAEIKQDIKILLAK